MVVFVVVVVVVVVVGVGVVFVNISSTRERDALIMDIPPTSSGVLIQFFGDHT